MVTWSHYRFQMRLLNKAREYPWCQVVIVSEAYTSKTCGKCGTINNKLGGSKVFKCGSCGLVCDRDKHAARNILLRYLTTVSGRGAGCSSTALRPTSAPAFGGGCTSVTNGSK